MLADDLTFGIALYPLRSGIPARYYTVRIEPDQCVIGRGFRKQSELPFAFAQRLGRQLFRRHVTADQIDQSILGGQRPSDPAPGAVLVAKPVFHSHRRDTLGEPLAAGHRVAGIVRMSQLADVQPLDLVLAPTEQSRPGGIYAGEITVEVGDAE